MYVKIINPKTNGRKVYSNSGSSQRCVNYLVAEAKKAAALQERRRPLYTSWRR